MKAGSWLAREYRNPMNQGGRSGRKSGEPSLGGARLRLLPGDVDVAGQPCLEQRAHHAQPLLFDSDGVLQYTRSRLDAPQLKVDRRHLGQEADDHGALALLRAGRLGGDGFRLQMPAAENIDFPARRQPAADGIAGRRDQLDPLRPRRRKHPADAFLPPAIGGDLHRRVKRRFRHGGALPDFLHPRSRDPEVPVGGHGSGDQVVQHWIAKAAPPVRERRFVRLAFGGGSVLPVPHLGQRQLGIDAGRRAGDQDQGGDRRSQADS